MILLGNHTRRRVLGDIQHYRLIHDLGYWADETANRSDQDYHSMARVHPGKTKSRHKNLRQALGVPLPCVFRTWEEDGTLALWVST